jgi:hypothetical protein
VEAQIFNLDGHLPWHRLRFTQPEQQPIDSARLIQCCQNLIGPNFHDPHIDIAVVVDLEPGSSNKVGCIVGHQGDNHWPS